MAISILIITIRIFELCLKLWKSQNQDNCNKVKTEFDAFMFFIDALKIGLSFMSIL